MADKPKGIRAFESLARKLMTVPKESADKIMAQKAAARKRRKRKK